MYCLLYHFVHVTSFDHTSSARTRIITQWQETKKLSIWSCVTCNCACWPSCIAKAWFIKSLYSLFFLTYCKQIVGKNIVVINLWNFMLLYLATRFYDSKLSTQNDSRRTLSYKNAPYQWKHRHTCCAYQRKKILQLKSSSFNWFASKRVYVKTDLWWEGLRRSGCIVKSCSPNWRGKTLTFQKFIFENHPTNVYIRSPRHRMFRCCEWLR